MLTRRVFGAGFGGCAICAAVGLVAAPANAQEVGQPQTMGGVTRTILKRSDHDEKFAILLVRADIGPNTAVARHTHPGIESAYVMEGEVELSVQGQPDRRIKAGGGFQVPPETPHAARNGDRTAKLAITYVVEKGKPLASPA